VKKYDTARLVSGDHIIRRMYFACQITKATDTHSEHVVFIPFFATTMVTQTLSVIPYKYIVCLVKNYVHHISRLLC
jgi:hypothetical protein